MSSATLDTNLLLEYWKNQKKRTVVERLVQLARDGALDLAVTSRIREDVPYPPLSEKIDALPKLEVREIGSVTRLDFWVLGRDMLGSDHFVETAGSLDAEFRRLGKTPPDWRDWDHLHAHFLSGRHVFLTWDRRVLDVAEELRMQLGMVVVTPEAYLATL